MQQRLTRANISLAKNVTKFKVSCCREASAETSPNESSIMREQDLSIMPMKSVADLQFASTVTELKRFRDVFSSEKLSSVESL